jgi:ferredoxin-NADP reductase
MGLRDWLEAPAADVSAPGRPTLNMVRGVASRLTTPLLPDDYLHLVNPLWSARELRGRVMEVRRETADSATLMIKPGWGFNFRYEPGQYIGIGVLLDGRWNWRSYSLTSPPHPEGKLISITVKAMPEGQLSSHLVNGVPKGTIVRLAAPKGNFALPEPAPAKILFLTAGSGLTPVIAMLRTMERRGQLRDVAHVHSAPTQDDVLFGRELESFAARYPNVVSHIQLTRTQGRFSLDSLDQVFPDWRERHTWACGPIAMLDEIEQRWTREGLTDKLHTERFEISRVGAGGEGGTVTFTRSGKVTGADGATSLLQAGEAAGVQMPFGCRMGICQTCVVMLNEGAVRDLRSGATHHGGERIQTCVSVAAGDCEIDV